MIILDTNILTNSDIDSAVTDLVKTIRASGVERVAVPWVVLEELTAHRTVPYREKYEAAEGALRSLNDRTPWQLRAMLAPMDLEAFQDHWRQKWLAVVDVIPTSEAALRQALIREANLLPPCKRVTINAGGDTQKIGGRDAAIWLTAAEYAREHPAETVYFVSKNTTDFGDGATYSYPMNEDLEGIEDRFVLLTTWYDVVNEFAVSTEPDEARVKEILAAPETADLVAKEVKRAYSIVAVPSLAGRFECTPAADLDLSTEAEAAHFAVAEGWLRPPTALFDSLWDVKAYSIGDHVWCTAWARWLLGGPALIRTMGGGVAVSCVWDTRVLVSTTNSDARPTLLRTKRLRASTYADMSKLPATSLPPRTLYVTDDRPGRLSPALEELLASGLLETGMRDKGEE